MTLGEWNVDKIAYNPGIIIFELQCKWTKTITTASIGRKKCFFGLNYFHFFFAWIDVGEIVANNRLNVYERVCVCAYVFVCHRACTILTGQWTEICTIYMFTTRIACVYLKFLSAVLLAAIQNTGFSCSLRKKLSASALYVRPDCGWYMLVCAPLAN